jgi:hypothetical protein
MLYLLSSISNSSKHWQPLSDDTSLANYSTLLHALARAVIVTLAGGGGGYQFPVTDRMKRAAGLLAVTLKSDANSEDAVCALHTFIYPFLSAREIVGCYSRWDEVLDCFLAVYSLNLDGTFRTAPETTQPLAILKYLCRGSTLYEAFRVAHKYNNNPQA